MLVFMLSGIVAGPGYYQPDKPVLVDVIDVPCDWDGEPAGVTVDSLGAQVYVRVFNSQCCCCGVDDPRGNLGLLRRGGDRTPPPPQTAPPHTPRQDTLVPPPIRDREDVGLLSPVRRGGQPPFPDVDANFQKEERQGSLAWLVALFGGVAIFLNGIEDRPPGGVCPDPDGASPHSGPPREGCWTKRQAPFRAFRDLSQGAY